MQNYYGTETHRTEFKSELTTDLDIENRTLAKITSQERIEKRLWNEVALREAVINAFVHNDYTTEIPPKFEIFNDRIEITSAGSLIAGLDKSEFFDGFSVPRNKELMRVYKDLGLVEQLGSGISRIIEYYDQSCFHFSEHFLRMVLPSSTDVYGETQQVTQQVKELLSVLTGEHSRTELQDLLGL